MNLDVKTVCELTKPLTLLYVEDDFNLRMETELFLNHFFSNITLADDGQHAVSQYKEKDFDLIISDINMPNMNGIEMANAIKDINNEQPFIFISAHDDSAHLMQL
jgi:CheY-like chemotaxis protein